MKEWICDKCGEVIEKAEDGYFEWKKNDADLNYGFRIVHFKTCQYNENLFAEDEYLQDLQLDEFVGADGLVRLLDLLSKRKFRDINEFLEVFHRLQVPFYEEARTYFEKALDDGYIEDIHDRGNKFSHSSIAIINKYANQEKRLSNTEILGHSSAETTRKFYADQSQERS
ncbi:hypothetical protein NDS46_29975 (plasmid) [Paenibacillus thiaminolyticus]|uniref:hypothetical protein n=1 Tax=Paenibacillus thiaminolyticus TaxID=49283 RepID=UPI00232E2D40|nr:hypothetical protein [Paenibacillus thiaminolyticus]WCF11577.1 hypothetical protein NDS46_29975 [Paenibacillus thiaminolyticus]